MMSYFPLGKGEFLLEGSTMPLPSVPVLGISSLFLPIKVPLAHNFNPFSLRCPFYLLLLPFCKSLFYSDPDRVCKGRLNHTCEYPLFIIHQCLKEKLAPLRTLVGCQSNWSWGLGLEIGHQASWDFRSPPLNSVLLSVTGQTWPSLGLSSLPLHEMEKYYFFLLVQHCWTWSLVIVLYWVMCAKLQELTACKRK